MRGKMRYPRSTLAIAIALIAFMFTMAGNVGAAPRLLVTLAGGPVNTPTLTDDSQVGNNETVIQLNGANSYTFTQRAGEALLVSAEATFTQGATANFCGARISVRAVGNYPAGGLLGLSMTTHTNKGDFGELTDSRGIPAPAAQRQITIEAVVTEGQRNDPGLATLYGPGDTCDGFGPDAQDPGNPDYDPYQDDFTASVRVSVFTIRG